MRFWRSTSKPTPPPPGVLIGGGLLAERALLQDADYCEGLEQGENGLTPVLAGKSELWIFGYETGLRRLMGATPFL